MVIGIEIPNYKVMVKDNVLYINDKSCPATKEMIEHIIDFTINWEDSYINDKYISGEYYYVQIQDKKYTFKNMFPDNFNQLRRYLGELYDRI